MNLESLNISTKALLDLTAIIDKMGIKDQLFNIDKKTNREVAIEVLKLVVTNLYKAEQEVYKFIVDYKKLMEKVEIDGSDMTKEEYEQEYQKQYFINEKEALEQAKQFNVISIFSDLLKIDGISDFLV